ncbi:RNA polymerase sigma factor [Pyxidicoccus trucidator]|uniref:RNA polymerase sigma factor n=1 Tax=Pyxidicoccus trucidator TaxID=2709662 RepID=UPI0013DA90E2|nr:sigma-70 family RNA polymerase sigma factor [Pyxidicoccus trucidator]
MQPREREALEQLIRELCRQGDVGGAVETALAGYGTELLRLMGSILKDPERTREAFSDFSELLVKDLPAFRWQSSFRTWAYQVARHLAYRHSAVGAAREIPVTRDAFAQEVQAARSQTQPWLQSAVKERFRSLRSRLGPYEQTLLTLRLDRRLSWEAVARELAPSSEPMTPEELRRRVAVLRQQFQRIKVRLRELAEEEHLLSTL